jgi:hypothetical protein
MQLDICQRQVLGVFEAHPKEAFTVEGVANYLNTTNLGAINRDIRSLIVLKKLRTLGSGHEEFSHTFRLKE